jgi:hypothetical protein
MSRRNMSERVNCGLMLCQGIAPLNGGTSTPGGSSPLRSSEDRNLSITIMMNTLILNSLVPGGVADQSEFRPLTQLLQNIGHSNRDGSTPIDTYDLSERSVKLLKDFMDKAGVPETGESPKRAEVLNTMQKTFGLSDTQVSGLLAKLSTGKGAFIPHPSQITGEDTFTTLPTPQLPTAKDVWGETVRVTREQNDAWMKQTTLDAMNQ